jgi:hypothetical protein
MAAEGKAVLSGSDQDLELFRYNCTVTPVAPAVARYWPV